jgi:non-heme chloroperoxidase
MKTKQTVIEFNDIDLGTGIRLRYASAGPCNGQPLLLLHGYSDSWFSFSRVVDLMPPHLRIIMPDQRGHGDSERPEQGYAMDDFAMDAVELLDGLSIASATVVGHSMGSFVAQRMAVLAPERVSGLVLIGSSATPRCDAVRGMMSAIAPLADPVDPAFVQDFQRSTIVRPVPAEFMERAIAESLKLPARVWKAAVAGIFDVPFTVVPGEIRCPTTIVWGDQDGMFGRADQEELLRRIPGAVLRVFPGVGHTPHWEVPEDFVRSLVRALE